ncbi:hypothetical protein YC2023_083044 [Brassica napus]
MGDEDEELLKKNILLQPRRGGLVVSTRRGIALLVQARDQFPSSAKLLAPHVATQIWAYVYGPFEYPGEDPSVGCTSHPGVRSVSLIDPNLIQFTKKKKYFAATEIVTDSVTT